MSASKKESCSRNSKLWTSSTHRLWKLPPIQETYFFPCRASSKSCTLDYRFVKYRIHSLLVSGLETPRYLELPLMFAFWRNHNGIGAYGQLRPCRDSTHVVNIGLAVLCLIPTAGTNTWAFWKIGKWFSSVRSLSHQYQLLVSRQR